MGLAGRCVGGRRSERGSVLLDYFLGASLFATSLGVFLNMSTLKLTTAGEAERRFRAVQAAESVLAELRAAGGAKMAAGTDWQDVVRFSVPDLPEGASAGLVRARRAANGLLEVRVVVTWPEDKEERRRVELASLVAP